MYHEPMDGRLMDGQAMDGTTKVSSSTVKATAAVLGLRLDDEATAARIAAGAGAAVAAVCEALSRAGDADALFEREPAEYLALLEALAEPSLDGPSAAAGSLAGSPVDPP